jgi:hypothetical protein
MEGFEVQGSKKIFKLVFAVFLILFAFGAYKYVVLAREIRILKNEQKANAVNTKILDFTRTFIEQVIVQNTPVDFEGRLKLENMVRDINDPAILDLWKDFVDSETEEAAQKNVVNLLLGLIDKIETK